MGDPRAFADLISVLEASQLIIVRSVRVWAPVRVPAVARRVALSIALIACSFLVAAWFGGTPPFEGRAYDPFAETSVLRALPFDAPLSEEMAFVTAGRGEDLAYRAQWSSTLPPAALATQLASKLENNNRWRLTQDPPETDEFTTTLVRVDSRGYMTHFAQLAITSQTGQTIVTFDFTPVPVALAPE